MNTALEHPLVASYLRDLDVALTRLPAAAAAELSDQLRMHLQEALPPDASADEVAAVLAALGPPAEVAAAAVAESRAPRRRLPRRVIARIGRLSWPVRILLAAIIVAILVPASSVMYWQAQASLTKSNSGTQWWYQVDQNHDVITQAAGYTQQTVPFRPGQMQGYVVLVFNPSDVTVRILGSPDRTLGGRLGFAQVAVSATATWQQMGTPHVVRYRRHGVIPPHSFRWVRVLWKTDGCNYGPGGGTDTSTAALWVRVGWITRVEVIPLGTQLTVLASNATYHSVYCQQHPEPFTSPPG